ncbi:MAG: benzoate/H(+) symporter BenE family transporter [Pseudomonadota bacterium]
MQWPPAGIRAFRRDVTPDALAAAFTAILISATGPFAILLSVSKSADLSPDMTASMAAVAYGAGGVLTLILCALYRQPITVLWTIAGITLLPAALTQMSFAEAMGASIVAALLLAALGWSGAINILMRFIPVPVALGMLLGVFLPFGTGMVTSIADAPLIAGTTVAAFAAASLFPAFSRRVPPIFAAMVAGAFALSFLPGDPIALPPLELVSPVFVMPVFRLDAILSLTPAMLMTMVAIHNGQSFAVMKARGVPPNYNGVTFALGLGGAFNGFFGAVPATLGTIHTALFSPLAPPESRWTASVTFGLLAILLGLLAPTAARLAFVLPAPFTATLAGLALLGILKQSFSEAFRGEDQMAALVAFLVSASGITIFGLAAPLWALIAGVAVSQSKSLMRRRT